MTENKEKKYFPSILFFSNKEVSRLFADVNDILLWLRLRGAYALERELRCRSGEANKSIDKKIEENNIWNIKSKENWEKEFNQESEKENNDKKNIFGPEPLKEVGKNKFGIIFRRKRKL